ncbi:sensor domain-containing protein [Planomicrobium okeanokoites]|uniref:EAL domain-containing protein n=1 Tax=Planomicrobium okeanokoites TaxID=244 RepID=A0ABV7KRV6_PLAOK
MSDFKKSRVVEMEGLLSFFSATEQREVNLFGEDVKILFWGLDVIENEIIFSVEFEEIYGYQVDEIEGDMLGEELFHSDSKDSQKSIIESYYKKEKIDVTYKIVKKDGQTAWVRTKGRPVFDSNGELKRYNGFTMDVTAPKIAAIEQAEAAMKYKTLVENNAQAVYISQPDGLKYVNERMADMTGYSDRELLGMNSLQLLDPESREIALKRVEHVLKGQDNDCQEVTMVRKDGSRIIAELRSALITYQNAPAMMGTLLDVTQKKKDEDLINSLAFFDTLTGLPNRHQFYEELNVFAETCGESNTSFALLFIGLDRFKSINDTYGHRAGDLVVKEAGKKIRGLLPESACVARYGDDEFVGIVPFSVKDEIELLVKQIIDLIPHTLPLEINMTPTVGISYFPEHTQDTDDLVRFADIAMYRSTRNKNRKQNYLVYDESFTSNLMKTNKLINDFQKALDEEQFHLVYQPKIDLQTLKPMGVETLIRWEHPEFGNIPPLEFIPLAEKSGKIVEIGNWVLKHSMEKIKAISPDLMLNVNVSVHQLLQDGFAEEVSSMLRDNSFNPGKLNLEITESVALYDVKNTLKVLHDLVGKGIKLSLDDFGTGYSSLSYLTKLPVHYLKIDRSFINGLEDDVSNRTLTKSILEVAHNLDLKVIAEGIETETQCEILKDWSCEIGQGYYFSKPLSLKDLKVFLKIPVK